MHPEKETRFGKILQSQFNFISRPPYYLSYLYETNKLRADKELNGKIVHLYRCKVRNVTEKDGIPSLQCDTREDGHFNFPVLFFEKDDLKSRERLIKTSAGNLLNFFCIGAGAYRTTPIFTNCRFGAELMNPLMETVRDDFLNDKTYVNAIKIASKRLNKKEKKACNTDSYTCYYELLYNDFKVIDKSLEIARKQSSKTTTKKQ